MTPEEEAALRSYGHDPSALRWRRLYEPRLANQATLDGIAERHQPALNYGGPGSHVPSCRYCRGSWPCDATRLLRTMRLAQEARP